MYMGLGIMCMVMCVLNAVLSICGVECISDDKGEYIYKICIAGFIGASIATTLLFIISLVHIDELEQYKEVVIKNKLTHQVFEVPDK